MRKRRWGFRLYPSLLALNTALSFFYCLSFRAVHPDSILIGCQSKRAPGNESTAPSLQSAIARLHRLRQCELAYRAILDFFSPPQRGVAGWGRPTCHSLCSIISDQDLSAHGDYIHLGEVKGNCDTEAVASLSEGCDCLLALPRAAAPCYFDIERLRLVSGVDIKGLLHSARIERVALWRVRSYASPRRSRKPEGTKGLPIQEHLCIVNLWCVTFGGQKGLGSVGAGTSGIFTFASNTK